MIRRLHSLLAPKAILDVLNERLVADLGSGASPYTMEQLHAELRVVAAPTAAAGDWAGLRKLIAHARDNGMLARVDAQLIDDFSVIYQLSPAQVLRLKDVLLSAKDDTEGDL